MIDAEPCAKLRSNLDDPGEGPFVAPVVVEVSDVCIASVARAHDRALATGYC